MASLSTVQANGETLEAPVLIYRRDLKKRSTSLTMIWYSIKGEVAQPQRVLLEAKKLGGWEGTTTGVPLAAPDETLSYRIRTSVRLASSASILLTDCKAEPLAAAFTCVEPRALPGTDLSYGPRDNGRFE